MFRLLCFIAVLPAIFGASRFHLNRRIRLEDTRIVGGKAVTIEEFPYQCSLQFHGSHICGCSIMNANTILTAAHCMDGYPPTDLSVRAGSTYRDTGGTVRIVVQIVEHYDYDSLTMDSDISILTLKSDLPFGDGIENIALDNEEPQVGLKATVSGWGTTSFGGSVSSQLRAVNVTIKNRYLCDIEYGGRITKSMICAAAIEKDSCQGDSGGPLVAYIGQPLAKRKQIGIVSWGEGCADPTHPGVYTNVPYFYDYIQKYLYD